MMKKWFALLLIAVLGLSLTACGEPDPAKEAAKVVAVVGKTNITKGEAQPIYDSYVKQYAYSYSYNGQTLDLNSKEVMATLKTNVLNILAEGVALELTLADAGNPLTQEDLDKLEVDAQTEYQSMITNYVDNNGVDEEAAKAAAEEQGYSLDFIRYIMRRDLVETRVIAMMDLNIDVTDEEIQTRYDSLAATATETYTTTPNQYASDILSSAAVYARPEGYRNIKNLVIPMSDETVTAVTAKDNELYTASYMAYIYQIQLSSGTSLDAETKTKYEEQLATYQADVTRLQGEFDELVKKGQEEIRAHAEEVLALAKAEGADFDALIAEYGSDTATIPYVLENGYPVAAGLTTYVTSFTEASMALAAVGDISDLVPSEYGFHILKYQSDVTPGQVPLDDVHEAVRTLIYDEKEDAAIESNLSALISKQTIKTYISRM